MRILVTKFRTVLSSSRILGVKRFAKSLWKTFKADFGQIEESISAAREEVSEEIKLASEQAEHEFRQLQMIENQENRRFRTQQISVLAETRDRRVQKIVMEEGNIPKGRDTTTGDNLITLFQNATEFDSCRRSKTTITIAAFARHNDRDMKGPVFGSSSARNSRNGSIKNQTLLHVTEFVSSS
jgi:hypothetical protein